MSSVAEVRAMVERGIEHLTEAQRRTSVANEARMAVVSTIGLTVSDLEEDIAHLVRISGRLDGAAGALSGMLNDAGDTGLQTAETATYSAGDSAQYGSQALAEAHQGSSSQALEAAVALAASAKGSYDEASSGYIVLMNRLQEAVAMFANAKTQLDAAIQQLPEQQLKQAHTYGYQVGMSLEAGYESATAAIEHAREYTATL